MGLNITEELRRRLQIMTKAEWKQKKVRYLGIKVLNTLRYWLEDNLIAYIHNMENLLKGWNKLRISWWGCKAIIKMKILPVILFSVPEFAYPNPNAVYKQNSEITEWIFVAV